MHGLTRQPWGGQGTYRGRERPSKSLETGPARLCFRHVAGSQPAGQVVVVEAGETRSPWARETSNALF